MTGKQETIRTTNDFFLGVADSSRLAPTIPMCITTRQQAYRTAAWIKLMGEALPDETLASTYEEVEAAIRST